VGVWEKKTNEHKRQDDKWFPRCAGFVQQGQVDKERIR
jgi:hypothetical protein